QRRPIKDRSIFFGSIQRSPGIKPNGQDILEMDHRNRSFQSCTTALVGPTWYPFGEHAMDHAAATINLQPLEPLLERIVAHLGPEEIWLFGSRAEGRARPDSDYDLLLVMPDGSPGDHLDVVSAWTLVQGSDIPADIVPCTRAEFEEEKHEIDTL